jgi:hypothetical protein
LKARLEPDRYYSLAGLIRLIEAQQVAELERRRRIGSYEDSKELSGQSVLGFERSMRAAS